MRLQFVCDRNRSYPMFTCIAGCSCHVPVPDAWRRYNRTTWWCRYATRFSAATAKAEPEIMPSTTPAVSRASAATAGALCRPESIMGYTMAAYTVGHTIASYSLSWDRCEATCGVRWQLRRRQFVELAWEDVHGSFERPSDHRTIRVPDCMRLPRPLPTRNLVRWVWWIQYHHQDRNQGVFSVLTWAYHGEAGGQVSLEFGSGGIVPPDFVMLQNFKHQITCITM